ncbi:MULTISPECIES: hypothetical protein [unclassified Beijerinckia]|uniref:hypothetical protein n=1 Tax=unclassified Beijerinckia TaxID=2638183 RepID=UPI00089555E6|nr:MULTISPECIES: hypothetical protein [unclassified Beijerinckia]MDH7796687.1 hypothetical protein [Beijerinckia sp. GAS462]SEC55738.1 hypothetical protein SAMN05443249_2971 [Beijerinckia sp. 28-YEA-48]
MTPGFAADTHAVRLAQANRCAIYGSGFVATTDGGCARIGGRVRVQRRVDQRTPIAAPPAPMAAPMGMPMTNGFQFSGGQRDGPSRAHLRLPSETNNVFAPGFR